MARGKWLERNIAARAAVKKCTAGYKAKWAAEKKARAADRKRCMCGE
jgi:hypothetical protein